MAKKELLSDLNTIVANSREEIINYNNEIECRRRVFSNLKKIVDNDAPTYSIVMEDIIAHFNESLSAEQDLIDAYERFAEDFNDVSARFDVVFRLSEEARECKQKVRDIKSKIEKVKNDIFNDEQKGSAKKEKLEAELQKLIQIKKAAVDTCIEKMEEFIVVKQKYNEFKIRRLTHAYTNLGNVMKNAHEKQLQNMNYICQKTEATRNNLDSMQRGGEEENNDVSEKKETDENVEQQNQSGDYNPFQESTHSEYFPPNFGD